MSMLPKAAAFQCLFLRSFSNKNGFDCCEQNGAEIDPLMNLKGNPG